MKGSGIIFLGVLIALGIAGYLNLVQRKTMITRANSSLKAPVQSSSAIPGAIKNQIDQDLNKSQNDLDKNMPDEVTDKNDSEGK